MTPRDLSHLAELVHRRSGLVIGANKARLAESKLTPVAARFGYRDCAAMLAELPHPPEELAEAITDAMTVNESFFFRDTDTFAHFRNAVLPAMLAARWNSRRLRIWCAAASTGQEAYSLAMMLDEMGLAAQGWKIDLIATDLSASAVARAKDGVYAQYEAQRGLDVQRLIDNFTQDGGNWRVAERLRRMVTFRVFNLLDHYGWLGEIDIVFCRNVLMYFDAETRAAVLAKIARILARDGALVLGDKEAAGPQWIADAARGFYKPHAAPHSERKLRAL